MRIKPGVVGRLRWSLRTGRKPTSPFCLPRMWWADFVLHPLFEIGERCQDCGRAFPLWRAPDDLYSDVYGSPHGILCPGCFSRRATAKGMVVSFDARLFKARE
jgi:hypothetical protein